MRCRCARAFVPHRRVGGVGGACGAGCGAPGRCVRSMGVGEGRPACRGTLALLRHQAPVRGRGASRVARAVTCGTPPSFPQAAAARRPHARRPPAPATPCPLPPHTHTRAHAPRLPPPRCRARRRRTRCLMPPTLTAASGSSTASPFMSMTSTARWVASEVKSPPLTPLSLALHVCRRAIRPERRTVRSPPPPPLQAAPSLDALASPRGIRLCPLQRISDMRTYTCTRAQDHTHRLASTHPTSTRVRAPPPTHLLPQDSHYLASIAVKDGKVFALLVRSPARVRTRRPRTPAGACGAMAGAAAPACPGCDAMQRVAFWVVPTRTPHPAHPCR